MRPSMTWSTRAMSSHSAALPHLARAYAGAISRQVCASAIAEMRTARGSRTDADGTLVSPAVGTCVAARPIIRPPRGSGCY